jgi:sugar lactone lactonase YvrE
MLSIRRQILLALVSGSGASLAGCGSVQSMRDKLPSALGGKPASADPRLDTVVAGSAFKGVHGLAFDKQDRLYAGSVLGQAVYSVDRNSGAVKTLVSGPQGMADDIAFAPDGTMAWTGFLTGDINASRDGKSTVLARGLPGINSLAYRADGRLFATQVFLGDALHEIDPAGIKPARKIMEGMGGLNGFQFGPDGKLYGPLWFKGQIVRVDVDSAKLEVIADGFKIPAAVNMDSKGFLWVVDTALGQLVRVDPRSGAKTITIQLNTSLDNLAIDSKDRIFVTNMADNGIQEVDPATGRTRQVIKGALAAPAGLALTAGREGDELHVADVFAYRRVNTRTGMITDIARMHGDTLEYPFSISANNRQALLSSWFTGSVQAIDRVTGRSQWIAHGLQAPHDAMELSDGSVVVAELGTGKLLRLSEQGKRRVTITEGLAGPVGLTSDGIGLYVTESLAGKVTRVDIATGVKREIAKDLKMPEGICRASDRQLIVTEVGAQRIVSVDTSTGFVAPIMDKLPIGFAGLPGVPPSYLPTGVAIGGDGAIYFSSDLDNAIYRIPRSARP